MTMRFRNAALAGIMAIVLGGAVALPHLMPVESSYADQTSAETAQEGSRQAGSESEGSQATIDGVAEKNEIVYASMNSAGKVKDLYVVNELIFDEADLAHGLWAYAKDYGTYERVTNLTNDSALNTEDESVLVEVVDRSFTYQGDLASSDLPWDVTVSYRLDGVSISAENLAGKSGELTLEVATSRNAAIDPLYFDNYMLQITVTLPLAHAVEVKTDDGQIALSGSNTTVAFTALPGKDRSFSLTAHVQDFEMDGISIAGIPFSMAIDSPDTDSLISQFDALIDGADELDKGASKLKDGATSLAAGTKRLDEGTQKLDSGSNELSAGVAAYIAGVSQVREGMSQAAAGSHVFASKLDEVARAGEGVSASLAATKEQMQAFIAQIQASSLSDAEKAGMIQQISGMASQLGGLDEYIAGVSALAQGYEQVDSSFDSLSSGLDELSQKGAALSQGVDELKSGTSELANSTGTLSQGANALASGTEELSSGTEQLRVETQAIPDNVQREIDEMMASYDKSDFMPRSFVDARNTGVKLVQFVMTTEAIQVPEPEAEEEPEEEETLLSRFFALFS